MLSLRSLTLHARLLTLGVLMFLASAAHSAQEAAWSAAWQAPQGDAFLSLAAEQATLRQLITSHAAGGQVRLRLSNFYGQKPIQVGAVSIGASEDAAQIAGKPVQVLFGGLPGVKLAPGESRYSDPVQLDVQPLQRMAVSLYFPESTLPMSRHFNANEYVWKAAGDLTGEASAKGFAQNTNLLLASTVLVDRLEIAAAPGVQRRVVAIFGDSITDGFMNSSTGIPLLPSKEPMGQDVRYPDFLQRRAQAEGVPATFVSAALSGNRLLAGPLLPMFGPTGQTRLERDVLSVAGITDAIVLIGINDLGYSLSPNVTSQKLVIGLGDVIQKLHAAGVKVTLGTLLPSRGASFGLAHGSAAVDVARQKVNLWIKTSSLADAVVDFDTCLQDPANPSFLPKVYDSGDGLHPNTAGYRKMAECVDLQNYR